MTMMTEDERRASYRRIRQALDRIRDKSKYLSAEEAEIVACALRQTVEQATERLRALDRRLGALEVDLADGERGRGSRADKPPVAPVPSGGLAG